MSINCLAKNPPVTPVEEAVMSFGFLLFVFLCTIPISGFLIFRELDNRKRKYREKKAKVLIYYHIEKLADNNLAPSTRWAALSTLLYGYHNLNDKKLGRTDELFILPLTRSNLDRIGYIVNNDAIFKILVNQDWHELTKDEENDRSSFANFDWQKRINELRAELMNSFAL